MANTTSHERKPGNRRRQRNSSTKNSPKNSNSSRTRRKNTRPSNKQSPSHQKATAVVTGSEAVKTSQKGLKISEQTSQPHAVQAPANLPSPQQSAPLTDTDHLDPLKIDSLPPLGSTDTVKFVVKILLGLAASAALVHLLFSQLRG